MSRDKPILNIFLFIMSALFVFAMIACGYLIGYRVYAIEQQQLQKELMEQALAYDPPSPSVATLRIDDSDTSIIIQDGDTVESILDRVHINIDNDDTVSVDKKARVYGGAVIVLHRVEVTKHYEVERIDYEVEKVADPTKYLGTEYTKQEGEKGAITKTYETTTIDDKDGKPKLIDTVEKEPVTKIVAYGTKVRQDPRKNEMSSTASSASGSSYRSGASQAGISHDDKDNHVITLSNGQKLNYSRVDAGFTATAYSGGGTTSTGRRAQVGVVAVDPRVIPYGTRMFITCGYKVYGVCVAGDCGGAIKGKIIDLYMNTESECNRFGRRGITVYFLK